MDDAAAKTGGMNSMKQFHFKDRNTEHASARQAVPKEGAPEQSDCMPNQPAQALQIDEEIDVETMPVSSKMDTVLEQVDSMHASHMIPGGQAEEETNLDRTSALNAEQQMFEDAHHVAADLPRASVEADESNAAQSECDLQQPQEGISLSLNKPAAPAAPAQNPVLAEQPSSIPQPEPYLSQNTVVEGKGPFVTSDGQHAVHPASYQAYTQMEKPALIRTNAGEAASFAVRYIINGVGVLIGFFGLFNNLPFTLLVSRLYSIAYALSYWNYYSIDFGDIILLLILLFFILVWFVLSLGLIVFSIYCLVQNIQKQRISLTVDENDVYGRDERGTAFRFPIASITDVKFIPSRLPKEFRQPWSSGLQIDTVNGKLVLPSLCNAGRVMQILNEKIAQRPAAPEAPKAPGTPPAAPRV